MPIFKRRQFLQFGGALLAALGYDHLEFGRITQHYGQVLAQPTRRKRALLVGIGDYPGGSSEDLKRRGWWPYLRGAVNDVLLQKELLKHRFGFAENDIVVLTDQTATRTNILAQFEQLIQWVQSPDDVVVFHYSGHGSNVIDPNQVFDDQVNGTIVPIDADLPLGYPQAGGEVDDITAGTIFLLREALGRRTNNVTFILDSCYSGGGVRGNLTLRSRPGHVELDLRSSSSTQLTMSSQELDYQQRWLTDLQLSKPDWIQRRRQIQINGAAMFASRRNQQAADAAIAKDFHAGVFTYALTRHLWQQSREQGMGQVVVATAAKTEQFLKAVEADKTQTPGLEVREGSADRRQPIYFTPLLNPPAEAVVTKIKGKSVELLLTGLEPTILEAFGKGAMFTVVDPQGNPQGTVEIEGRDRLTATGLYQQERTSADATMLNQFPSTSGFSLPCLGNKATDRSARKNRFKLKPGTALQEQLRSLPPDLSLRIGLDQSLGADRSAAKRALESLPRIEVVPLLEQEVDYILGRVSLAYRQALADQVQQTVPSAQRQQALAELPPVNSVALFSVGLALIPNTYRTTERGIGGAIASLQTKFKVLLAARIVKLTLNTSSSQLNVAARLKVAEDQELLAQSFTVRGGGDPTDGVQVINPTTVKLAQIPIRKPIQISVVNRDYRDLHLAVLIFSPDGDIDILFPRSDGPDAALVPRGEILDLPSAIEIQDGASLSFKRPWGVAELLILASTTSIQKALVPIQVLAQEQRSVSRSESLVAEKAEGAIASLLDDLASETRGEEGSEWVDRLFDPKQMAALSIPFEIVDEA